MTPHTTALLRKIVRAPGPLPEVRLHVDDMAAVRTGCAGKLMWLEGEPPMFLALRVVRDDSAPRLVPGAKA